ncbi:ABC transporter permease [Arenibaculum pallidiluteum]|uniref:ABC transporter permease n=1 Tax=Arenibaculum pallidiluteum TaxID=2812559 RepID=UPI001A96C173|nr:ABC transporter permease [Arenibaculum pallidiluteum]
MIAFLARRLVATLATLLAASVVVFLVLEVLPGDPALLMLGTEARPDTLAALRGQMGLDQPAPLRYAAWLGDMASGQFGVSYTYGRPVGELVAERLAVTVPLALMALVLSVAVALPLGILAAARHGGAGDWGVMVFSQLGISVPGFWTGMLLVLLFSGQLGWLPSGGFPGWGNPGAAFAALVLPAVSLAFYEAAIFARVTRSAVLDTLREDYVRTARAKGLGWRAVLWRHVLRNALAPVVTILGLQFSFLWAAGTLVIENVFYLPGMGRLLYQAITQRDLIVVRDVVMMLVGVVLLVNLAVDLLYAAIDPRPRAGTGG